jgi:hypothetical protein
VTPTRVRVFFACDGVAWLLAHVYMSCMAKSDAGIVKFDTEGRKLLVKALALTTEAEIAKAIGCAQQQVSSWKRGQSRPKPEFREALKGIIGVPVEAWFTRRELVIARARPPSPAPRRTGTDG